MSQLAHHKFAAFSLFFFCHHVLFIPFFFFFAALDNLTDQITDRWKPITAIKRILDECRNGFGRWERQIDCERHSDRRGMQVKRGMYQIGWDAEVAHQDESRTQAEIKLVHFSPVFDVFFYFIFFCLQRVHAQSIFAWMTQIQIIIKINSNLAANVVLAIGRGKYNRKYSGIHASGKLNL